MTQNTPTIYQRLEKLEGELQKLTNTVYALKVTDIQNYDKNFEEIGNEADRLVTNVIKELTDTKGEYYTSLRNLANGKLNMFDEKSSELYTLTND